MRKIANGRDDFTVIPPRIGDLVRLASGSPLMTIVDVSADGQQVTAAWRSDQGARELQIARVCVHRVVA
ncbi:MAG: hypothetical protein U5L06_00635 [Rhodovibrio sp.]|nr:hypothetical protein [Rhodovibrio sp.]